MIYYSHVYSNRPIHGMQKGLIPHFSFRPSPKTGHPSHLPKLPIPCGALGIEVCDPLKKSQVKITLLFPSLKIMVAEKY